MSEISEWAEEELRKYASSEISRVIKVTQDELEYLHSIGYQLSFFVSSQGEDTSDRRFFIKDRETLNSCKNVLQKIKLQLNLD